MLCAAAGWGVSTRSCSVGQAAAATACRAANTPPANTYRTIAANGMRRYTRMHPATSPHAALMKSDIRILTGLSRSISGFGKNSILTSLLQRYITITPYFTSGHQSLPCKGNCTDVIRTQTQNDFCCFPSVTFEPLHYLLNFRVFLH